MPNTAGETGSASSSSRPSRAKAAPAKRQSKKPKNSVVDVEAAKREQKSIKLKGLFKQFDTDGNGTMSRRELELVLTKLGKFDGREISRVMDAVDKNNDGVIQFAEFVDWMTGGAGAPNLEDRSAMGVNFEELAKPLFAIWDRDGSGSISREEFQQCHEVMKRALHVVAEKKALAKGAIGKNGDQVVTLVSGHEDTVWRAADHNNDDQVCMSEFSDWLRGSVEHAGLEQERILELVTQLTLLLQTVIAGSGTLGMRKGAVSRTSTLDLVEKLGELSSELFKRTKDKDTKAGDESRFEIADPELWRQLPGPDSWEKVIHKHMEDALTPQGVLKFEVSVKMCIPTCVEGKTLQLCQIQRTTVHRTRQGDVPPGQPVYEQYFYANDSTDWQSIDGSEFLPKVTALPKEMRLYARMHAAAEFKDHLFWCSIQTVLQEAVQVGLLTIEDVMNYNNSIERAVVIALGRKESLDEMTEESERREKAKMILPEVRFNVLQVMAKLAELEITPSQPLWADVKFILSDAHLP